MRPYCGAAIMIGAAIFAEDETASGVPMRGLTISGRLVANRGGVTTLLGCRIAELAAVHVAPRSTLVMRHCVIHAASRTIKKLITVGKHATLKMHDCRIVLLQRSSRFSHQDLIYAHTSASSRRRAARLRSLRLF